jgi:HK97 family phage prohead protease
MNSKANELMDKLSGMANDYQQLDAQPNKYNVGDTVSIMRDGMNYVATVEAFDMGKYTVRVQAVAGNEFEATDKVYVCEESELADYEPPKSFDVGEVVEWKSQVGITIGEIVSVDDDGIYTIEVFAQDERKEYEPTYVTVNLTADYLRKSDAVLKPRKGVIMVKMDDMNMSLDDKTNIGRLMGVGGSYGNVDLGGDTVKRGAYTQTIKHKEGKVPLFIDHGWDMKTFMGVAFLEDSDDGLMVQGDMPLYASDVKDVFIKTKFALEKGIRMGFSIGYDVIKSRFLPDGTRELQEIALHEISITPFPMDTNARILSARSKRIAYKAMQTKWATPNIDAPTGNQDDTQGAIEALAELKSILNKQ